MQLSTLTLILVIGLVHAQDSINDITDLADKIPGFENIDKSKVPTVENAEKIFKEKCIKYGGEEAFDRASAAKEDLIQCVKSQINVTVLQEEMENAKPTGDLDTVFGKYCKKTPIMMACMKNFTTALDPCLEEKEKENKAMVLNITESLANFLCHKDGDRIAMFIAEGGLECMTEKQDAVQACANATFGSKIPTEMPELDNLPIFVIKEEQCNDLTKLQDCVVAELEKCSQPTPANIMESLFKFIRRVTPCDTLGKGGKEKSAKKQIRTNSASNILSSVTLITGALLLKFF